ALRPSLRPAIFDCDRVAAKYPIVGSFARCCARAASGQAAPANAVNWRRVIFSMGAPTLASLHGSAGCVRSNPTRAVAVKTRAAKGSGSKPCPAVAAELAKAPVDAIVAGGAAAARAAQGATSAIPIFTLTDDMVAQGLVASLAHPGGNTTGISILATELDGKRQDILIEMVPTARRMAVLGDANTAAPANMRALQEAARRRDVVLDVRLVERAERIVPEIEEAKRAGADAVNVLASPILYG